MDYRPLGRTGLTVSALCLGTMTFGEQNTEDEGFAQMDLARDRGITFIDAAEMYPVAPRPETQGRTEEIVGRWLAARGGRDRMVLATKAAGPGGMDWIRGEGRRLDRANILAAVDGSLKRLGTDYIDLYYLHWPDRPTNYFGRLGYVHKANADFVALEESLAALAECIAAGKIRHVGLSNETPWGLMQALHLAESRGLPRPACIQNPYNLLNRSFEIGLAECAVREDVGLCAYSPLGFGTLTGKYLGGQKPPGCRLTLFPERYGRYVKPRGVAGTQAYVDIARRHGLDPAQMALAYVTSRAFTTSTILGATSVGQLRTNIDSVNLALPDAVMAEIEAVHADNPNPCP